MSRWQEKITHTPTHAYVGIDVSKLQLDVFIYPQGRQLQVANETGAIRTLVRDLTKAEVKLVALEATGKYHRAAHSMLHEAGIPVAVVNPFRSRQFADSMGKLAKTDTIDAEVLARFAQRMEPSPTAPAGIPQKMLHELHVARRQVSDEAADLKRQLQSADHPLAKKQIAERITIAERHKHILEAEIQAIIAAVPDLKAKVDILISVPNIGRITAAILLADLTELGQANAREIAALAGVAPMNWDSGKKIRKQDDTWRKKGSSQCTLYVRCQCDPPVGSVRSDLSPPDQTRKGFESCTDGRDAKAGHNRQYPPGRKSKVAT